MILRPCAVAGLLALAASSRIIVSAQPFSTLAAQNVAENPDTDISATHRPRPQPPRAPKEEEQHGEFGNVAESTAASTTNANGQGGDNGQPGTFQFLGVSGGDDDGDEIGSSIA